MKTLKIIAVVTLIAALFLTIGLASALQASDATVTAYLSNTSPKAGNPVTISVTFQSNTATEMQVLRVGIHGDWMDDQGFEGPNMMDDPIPVQANGVYTTQFMVTIPSTASIGSHSYYVGVDVADPTGSTFSFDSAHATIQVIPASAAGTPTPTANPEGGPTGNSPDLTVYLAIIAVAVVVVVIVLVMMMRRKRGHTYAAPAPAKEAENPQEQPKPEEKQDFNI